MEKKFQKIIFSLLIVFGVLLVIVIQSAPRDGDDAGAEAGNLAPLHQEMEIHFLDVGQGDAIYIRTPYDQDILIDGGPDKNVLSELGRVMPFWDHEIDIMILTHPHSDHVTGLVEVLRRFDVKEIYYTGVLHTAPDYLTWLNEIQKQNLHLNIVQDFFAVKLGPDLELQFLAPQKNLINKKVEELNNTSIVNKLIYGKTSFLFMGDAEVEEEAELLEDVKITSENTSSYELKSNVIKLGHHGSTSSSSEVFLQAVKPELGIICVGTDNEFGHPHLQTIKRLERLQIPFLRTDLDGRITIISDAQNFWIKD